MTKALLTLRHILKIFWYCFWWTGQKCFLGGTWTLCKGY